MMQETDYTMREEQGTKKIFVEPEVSQSVDVLEATAFFQVLTGGSDVGANFTT